MKNKISIDDSDTRYRKPDPNFKIPEKEKKELMKYYNENLKDDIEKMRKEKLNGIK